MATHAKLDRKLLNTPLDATPDTEILIDGRHFPAHAGEPLINALNRYAKTYSTRETPQVCYHEMMGPIQSCDTCMVQVDGQLVRACATPVAANMFVATEGETVDIAQREAFDRILQNHMLYCTVCDNNNQNCVVHNTTAVLDVKHQAREYTPKPYEKDMSNP
ncbi:MAG TPA: 2Fe-2S iron-sulfur cluster-binding protein, partial [Granulicella sp.]